MYWKMFSSTPGLYTLEANSRRELTYSNIQINKVIGENEKSVSYLMGETIQTLWPIQYKHSLGIETNWQCWVIR